MFFILFFSSKVEYSTYQTPFFLYVCVSYSIACIKHLFALVKSFNFMKLVAKPSLYYLPKLLLYLTKSITDKKSVFHLLLWTFLKH